MNTAMAEFARKELKLKADPEAARSGQRFFKEAG